VAKFKVDSYSTPIYHARQYKATEMGKPDTGRTKGDLCALWTWNKGMAGIILFWKGELLTDLYNEIARVAYDLWEKRGRTEGTECEDWYKAETIVRSYYAQEGAATRVTGTKAKTTKKAGPAKDKTKVAKVETKGPVKKAKPAASTKK
jgi:hypothetical protein